ncbi:Phospholipase D1, partial [Dissophora globulifera]
MLNPTPTHRTDGNSEQASSSRRQKLGNIFRKDSIRNALFMNSAASAFTKKHRSENLQNIDMPIASIAVTGAAVPALWLRRDDKGRRPIAITDSEIDLGVSKQIIFRVELQYGDVKWVVRRSLFEFYKLHVILAAKRFENLPKFPGQLVYAFSMAKASMGMKAEDKITYLRQTNLARRQAIQQYLIQLLQQLNLTIAYDLYEFLEISAMSLTKDMGWKGKEAYIDTKVTNKAGTICGFPRISRWDRNWAILRDSYLAFCPTVGSSEPTDVFIFDQTFFVQQREHHLGLNMHHIEIGNSHRVIEIKGEHNREMIEWMDYFTRMKTSSPWVISHRFGSFAPEREEAKVRYYVDGKDYFHAVSDGILAAKTEIYICDWWLSPELYLRRPPEENEEFRLDRLLKRKAMEGVMIYVVVYKEIALALTLDSAHTKIWLQDLHPNIQVQRHPDHLNMKATQFWAHHEKICVIDCRLAFMGGLDLCFGRYDSRTHQLADYHPSGKGTVWPGQDYSNPRIKDFVNVKDYNADLIEKRLLARMPWHDVSLGVAGQPARDIARHFVQRWNFVKLEKGMKKSKARMKFLTPKGEFVSTRNESGWTGTQKVQILRSSTLWSQGVDLERSIQDAYLTSIAKAEHFIYIENQFFVTLAAENGNPDIKNTIGIALVERILRAHREGKKFRVIVVMPLMPAFEADIISSEAGTLRKVMHFQYMSICRGGNSVIERLQANGVNASDYIGFFGLRSFDRIKHGKFDAIVEAIREAELTRKGGSATMDAKATAEPEQIVPASPISDERPQQQDGDSVRSGDSASSGEELRAKSSKQPAVPPKTKKGSLSSKYLLEPIPKGQEAARVLAIAERRKALDARKTWDDSITKRAMNPSRVQLGYVPAATETSMADAELTSLIEEETDQAEIDAQEASYRQSGQSDAQVLDGMGTVTRNAVENAKGTKEGGNLEPLHRRIARGPRIQRLRHPRHHGDDGGDGVQDASGSNEQISETPEYGYETVEEESAMDANGMPLENRRPLVEAEKIIEPTPAASSSGTTSASTLKESATAEPAEFPKADAPGPATIERPVVDNEVDDFVTEQLYIHSKLMIIDDRVIICGS